MHGQSSTSAWRGDNVNLDVKRYAFKTAGLFQSSILHMKSCIFLRCPLYSLLGEIIGGGVGINLCLVFQLR